MAEIGEPEHTVRRERTPLPEFVPASPEQNPVTAPAVDPSEQPAPDHELPEYEPETAPAEPVEVPA